MGGESGGDCVSMGGECGGDCCDECDEWVVLLQKTKFQIQTSIKN